LTNSLFLHDSSNPIVDASTENAPSSKTDFIVNQRLLLLQQSNWFKTPDYQLLQSFPELPHVTDMLMKQWKTDLKFQETASIQKIRIKTDIQNPTISPHNFVPPTEQANTGDPQKDISSICADTEAPNFNTAQQTLNMDPETVIN